MTETGRRCSSARSSASVTNAASIVSPTDQPTTRRLNTSSTTFRRGRPSSSHRRRAGSDAQAPAPALATHRRSHRDGLPRIARPDLRVRRRERHGAHVVDRHGSERVALDLQRHVPEVHVRVADEAAEALERSDRLDVLRMRFPSPTSQVGIDGIRDLPERLRSALRSSAESGCSSDPLAFRCGGRRWILPYRRPCRRSLGWRARAR